MSNSDTVVRAFPQSQMVLVPASDIRALKEDIDMIMSWIREFNNGHNPKEINAEQLLNNIWEALGEIEIEFPED